MRGPRRKAAATTRRRIPDPESPGCGWCLWARRSGGEEKQTINFEILSWVCIQKDRYDAFLHLSPSADHTPPSPSPRRVQTKCEPLLKRRGRAVNGGAPGEVGEGHSGRLLVLRLRRGRRRSTSTHRRAPITHAELADPRFWVTAVTANTDSRVVLGLYPLLPSLVCCPSRSASVHRKSAIAPKGRCATFSPSRRAGAG